MSKTLSLVLATISITLTIVVSIVGVMSVKNTKDVLSAYEESYMEYGYYQIDNLDVSSEAKYRLKNLVRDAYEFDYSEEQFDYEMKLILEDEYNVDI